MDLVDQGAKKGDRLGQWLVAAGGFMLILSASFMAWAITSAQLRFLPCPDGFAIFSPMRECRQPAVAQAASLASFGIASALIALVLVRRYRRRSPER
jgi:hypothetical protein